MVQKSEGKRKSLEEICEMGAGLSSSWHQGQHGPMVSWHCRAPSCHTGCFVQSSVLKMQPEKSLVRCHTIKIPMPAPWVGKQRFKKTSQDPRAVSRSLQSCSKTVVAVLLVQQRCFVVSLPLPPP